VRIGLWAGRTIVQNTATENTSVSEDGKQNGGHKGGMTHREGTRGLLCPGGVQQGSRKKKNWSKKEKNECRKAEKDGVDEPKVASVSRR